MGSPFIAVASARVARSVTLLLQYRQPDRDGMQSTEAATAHAQKGAINYHAEKYSLTGIHIPSRDIIYVLSPFLVSCLSHFAVFPEFKWLQITEHRESCVTEVMLWKLRGTRKRIVFHLI